MYPLWGLAEPCGTKRHNDHIPSETRRFFSRPLLLCGEKRTRSAVFVSDGG